MRRIGMILAAMAALGGAPSPAFAAPANQLAAATVSPTGGTATTVFALRVDYVSSANNAALAVTADVAGVTVPLTRASGTAANGTWTGTVGSLPAGSWRVIFRADAEQGKDPSLSGPLVTVSAPVATTAPAAPSAEQPPEPVATTGPQPPGPAAGASPTAIARPTAVAAPAAPSTAADGPSDPSAAAVASRGATASAAPAPGSAASAAPAGVGSATDRAVASAHPSSATGGGTDAVTDPLPEQLNPWLWPLAGASTAAAALVGLFVVLGGGRSDDDELAAETSAAPVPTQPTANDEATDPATERSAASRRHREARRD